MDNNLAEIYRQRYETFRHLDRIRWQMLQLLVAVGSAFALTVRVSARGPDWWLLISIGMILAIISWVSFVINRGIRANGVVLSEVGEQIGDVNIPIPNSPWKASSHWIAMCIAILAILFFVIGVREYWSI